MCQRSSRPNLVTDGHYNLLVLIDAERTPCPLFDVFFFTSFTMSARSGWASVVMCQLSPLAVEYIRLTRPSVPRTLYFASLDTLCGQLPGNTVNVFYLLLLKPKFGG